MFWIFRTFILFLLFGFSLLYASIGNVSLLKGNASVERLGVMLDVKNGMELEEKDSIKTTKGSQIQLIFTDKTVITLGSESHFKVAEYLSEGSSPKAKFKFNQGTFKTITGRIGKSAPENFTLETKTATIGIRGTIIGGNISQSPSEPDSIICLGGQITATSLQNGVTVNLPTGTITVVPVNGSPSSPREITPQDIAQFNQSLGTPPAPAPEDSAPSQGSDEGSQSSSEGNSEASANNSEASSQSTSQTSNKESFAMSNEAPSPPPLAASSLPQTFTPTAAANAQQTNLQNTTQNNNIKGIAQESGVPIEQIQKLVSSNNPAITPPPPPPVVVPKPEPTPPPVVVPTPEPTPPPVVVPTPEPTPPPVVVPTPEPTPPPVVVPTPEPTPPPQPPAYTTLFSNMSAADNATADVTFPGESTPRAMAFDATNNLWVSSDNLYIVTTTAGGNFSYINTELSAAQKMYVKDTLNNKELFFKSFPNSGETGYLDGVSGLVPIASTWSELVTSVKSVMIPDAYTYAIKDELNTHYTTRKWNYTAGTKLF